MEKEGGWGRGPSSRNSASQGSEARKQSLLLFRLLAGCQLDNVCLQPRAPEVEKGNVSQKQLAWGHPWREAWIGTWSGSSNFLLWLQGGWQFSDGRVGDGLPVPVHQRHMPSQASSDEREQRRRLPCQAVQVAPATLQRPAGLAHMLAPEPQSSLHSGAALPPCGAAGGSGVSDAGIVCSPMGCVLLVPSKKTAHTQAPHEACGISLWAETALKWEGGRVGPAA